MQEFVETNLVEAATNQKFYYDQRATATTFAKGDPVWLSIPNTGKLSPQWEGGWKISECKSPVTMTINDEEHFKTVHVNHLRHRIQLEPDESSDFMSQTVMSPWNPPQIEHSVISAESPEQRYSVRERRPPDH